MDYKELKKAYCNFGHYGPKSLDAGSDATDNELVSNSGELQNYLISMHLDNTGIFIQACEVELRSFPEIFDLLVRFPDTLRVTKQIYLNRSDPVYNHLFLKLTRLPSGKILSLFSEYYQIDSEADAVYLMEISLESWFSKINTEFLDAQKMFRQFDETIKMLLNLKAIISSGSGKDINN